MAEELFFCPNLGAVILIIMRVSFIILCVVLFGFAAPIESIIVVSPEGLTGITFGKSTLKDVVELYGEQVVECKQKRKEFQWFGHTEYFVEVVGIGKFETYYPKKDH